MFIPTYRNIIDLLNKLNIKSIIHSECASIVNKIFRCIISIWLLTVWNNISTIMSNKRSENIATSYKISKTKILGMFKTTIKKPFINIHHSKVISNHKKLIVISHWEMMNLVWLWLLDLLKIDYVHAIKLPWLIWCKYYLRIIWNYSFMTCLSISHW